MPPAFDHAFTRTAAVLVVAALVGALALVLRQPLIVGFIGAGILVGPVGLDWVSGGEEFALLAELGIAVLLFLVGLKLDPKLVRSTGAVALATGLGQVFLTAILGFGLALALGFTWLPAAYLALALTFSSTIIVVKLLSDKRELEDLHGRIAVGVLIVQDIVVVVALIAVASLGGAGAAVEGSVASSMLGTALRAVAFVGAVLFVMRFVMPSLLGRLAKSRELLLLASITWAVGLAAAGKSLGFSGEVGAFLAGFTLAGTPYREAIASRLVSLRDFLLLFFFLKLGAELELGQAAELLWPAAVLSVFVLIGHPVIVLLIMGAMGYRARTGFLAGLTMAQISEFSLILVALGAEVGHVDSGVVGLVTAVALVTIALSTYLILNSGALYQRLAPHLALFERKHLTRAEAADSQSDAVPHTVVFGLGRHGQGVVLSLQQEGRRVLGVDIDPDAIRWAKENRVDVLFGDAGEPEIASSLPIEHIQWVISAIPHVEESLALVHGLRAAGYRGQIAATARGHRDAALLEKAGVNLVLSPHLVAADRLLERMRASAGAGAN
ncbi:MAG: sodium:proton exchanger [Planctomycetaceae bacterium]|nr:sodium:proton exchanger [Planctomycetaceae bacterium]